MAPPPVPEAQAAGEITALLKAGSYSQAAAQAELGVESWPQSAGLWSLLGAARILNGELLAGYRAATRALDLDPHVVGARENAAMALNRLRAPYREALELLATPQDEANRLEAAYRAVAAADDEGLLEGGAKGVAMGLFLRLAATAEADRRWPFADLGPDLAAHDQHRNLIYQLPRVTDDADRHVLLAQHQAWGRAAEARASADLIRPMARSRDRTRPRVGLLSSDLRIHVVGAFADPLIGQAQAAGVDLYGYSAFSGAPDGFQQHVASQVAGFRHLPGAGATDMARAIAADSLDVLVEIGASSNDNRLEAMAHRLAPVQASWLGYPHSAGLSTIDYMVLDPHLAPTEPDLILERPLLMPHAWLAMSPGYFRTDIPQARFPPQDHKGHVTFGTAGSPYKYSAVTLDAWARVLSAVPGSRFLIVRPEGGSAIFRANIAQRFARHGVDAARIEYAPVRGGHLPYYDQMDVSLDTLPLTGGMTTCEALWMGVPVVTLAGAAVYERLSHSLLTNAGLADLSTTSVDAFVAKAVELAADRARLADWRQTGRARIMAGPLGDLPRFGADFFKLVTSVL